MKRVMSILWIAAVILFEGCSRVSAVQTTLPPSKLTSACAPLDMSAPGTLQEVFTGAKPSGSNAEVVALQALSSSDIVVSLHIGNPSLRRWRLWDPNPVMEAELGIVSPVAAGFSQSGDLAIGATTSDESRWRGRIEPREHVGGVLVWDTETGTLITCLRTPCPNRPPLDGTPLPTMVGGALHPDGSRALIYNELVIDRVSIPDGIDEMVYQAIVPDMHSDEDRTTIGFVAYDQSGERYAIGAEEGQVTVVRPGRWWNFFNIPLVLGSNDESDLESIQSMTFSPDGEWLAQARGESLRVWDLGQAQRDPGLELVIKGAKALAFDRTSQYLFVAGGDKIVVIDLTDGGAVGQYPTTGISALTVSHDNRLLIWGDVSGSIHALGNCGT